MRASSPSSVTRSSDWYTRIGVLFLHLLGGFAIYYGITSGFSVQAGIAASVLLVCAGLGVTIGYHRYFTHAGFQCGNVLKNILCLCGILGLQGPPTQWVTDHKLHHRYSDQELDPHSPNDGFLWAHMFWIFYHYYSPEREALKKQVGSDAVVAFYSQSRVYFPLALGIGFLLPFIIPFVLFGLKEGIATLLLAGVLRILFSLHSTWAVNSICHTIGSQPWDSTRARDRYRDRSKNNIFIAATTFGEGYHNNHHVMPRCAIHGWRWYDIDISKWVIIVFERLGFVWDVCKPQDIPKQFLEMNRYKTKPFPVPLHYAKAFQELTA